MSWAWRVGQGVSRGGGDGGSRGELGPRGRERAVTSKQPSSPDGRRGALGTVRTGWAQPTETLQYQLQGRLCCAAGDPWELRDGLGLGSGKHSLEVAVADIPVAQSDYARATLRHLYVKCIHLILSEPLQVRKQRCREESWTLPVVVGGTAGTLETLVNWEVDEIVAL